MNNKWIAVLVVVLVALGGFFLFKDKSEAPTEPAEETSVENMVPVPGSSVDEMIVEETVKEFTIDNQGFSFKPSSLSVNKGDTVKITFRNTGGTHNLKIDEFTGAATRILSAGESETITFVADKSGSFEYYCSVGNHRAQGMWGTLTVK
ncbi:MAG: plastocyanin/azurin family copper-binding protein [Minisyncoccia bacterium]